MFGIFSFCFLVGLVLVVGYVTVKNILNGKIFIEE